LTVASRNDLDTSPLGRISHPRPNREIANWLERLIREGAIIYIPEIADYEVRRELIRAGLQESVNRRDRLKSVLNYLPINTDVMLKAAALRAQAPNRAIHIEPSLSNSCLSPITNTFSLFCICLAARLISIPSNS
jgi:predicted nucleic acid-binding protein